ncbi:uncharacterized protein LOC126776409 isoform X3 [Nymphalis io]|uniref:uncharacterized protein LOC126776409 isoform X3 n=1 Tax=Inachis io TaxID=171585 RepID=UPI0021676265|nr:uncharacterized protein LOC126776409 isoform X3 [Nymphalis io]
MKNMKYRYIYEYEFYRGTSATETARRIIDLYGAGVAKESTVHFWFQRFHSGNFDLQNQPRGRPETKVENEELKAIVEADSSQSTSEIAAVFRPGRVVTLIPADDPSSKVWGVAYKIRTEDVEQVTNHLDFREKNGYSKKTFHPKDSNLEPIILTLYVATMDNESYAALYVFQVQHL